MGVLIIVGFAVLITEIGLRIADPERGRDQAAPASAPAGLATAAAGTDLAIRMPRETEQVTLSTTDTHAVVMVTLRNGDRHLMMIDTATGQTRHMPMPLDDVPAPVVGPTPTNVD